MSEMVERVARAISGHFGPEYDRLPLDKAELRSVRRHSVVYSDNTQDDMLEAARAAIAALREPTMHMKQEAGDTIVVGCCNLQLRDAHETWQVMIDAALTRPEATQHG